LRGSAEVQTAQLQPITGTPIEVPVPKKRSRIAHSGVQHKGRACRAGEIIAHGRPEIGLNGNA
jgi:hypothetical protein